MREVLKDRDQEKDLNSAFFSDAKAHGISAFVWTVTVQQRQLATCGQRILSIIAGGPEILSGTQQAKMQNPEESDSPWAHRQPGRVDFSIHGVAPRALGVFLEPVEQGHRKLGAERLVVLVPPTEMSSFF